MKRCIFAVLMMAALLLGLCGCGMTDDDYVHEGESVVIIVGNHANANRYSDEVVTRDIRRMLENAVSREIIGKDYVATLNVSIIVSDGHPVKERIMLEGYEIDLVSEEKSAEKSMREIEHMIEDVEDYLLLDSLRAVEPGSDLPAAVAEAERIIRNNPGARNRIYIYDTGIVTEGKMAMGVEENQLDIQDGTVEEVLNRLGDNFFPNLEGIDVEFYGLGDVCTGQKDMRDMQDTILTTQFIDLWTSFFLDRCKADSLNALTIADKGDAAMLWDVETDPYPMVRNVPFYDTPLPPEPDNNTGEEEKTEEPKLANLSASELGGFKGDEGVFLNHEQACAALKSYFDSTLKHILDHPGTKLYVVGSCAVTDPELGTRMDYSSSRERAIAVSELIQEMFGIPAEQIVEIDAGDQRFSWSSKAEEFPGGKWGPKAQREAAQAEHRVVTLIPATENNQSRLDELAHEQDILP